MNKALPRFAVNHPVTVLMVVATFIGLGIISWHMLPLDFTIKLEFPFLRCFIPYAGASPEQVEKEVAIPAEGEFLTIPGLRRITCRSDGGGCYIGLEFDWNTNMRLAAAELRDRIERLKLKLPQEIEHIFVRKFGSQQWAIIRFALFRGENDTELGQLARTLVYNRLMRVEGIAEVRVSGSSDEEVKVEFDQDALGSLSLPLPSVISALQTTNLNLSLGELIDADNKLFIRAQDELSRPKELEDVVVGPNTLRLKDIADVKVEIPPDYGSFTIDGKRAVFVEILKESEANIVDACDAVKKELAALLKDPELEGVNVLMFEDKSEHIRFAIGGLLDSGTYGLLLSLIVIFLFLLRIRATLLVAIATPISLMASFIFMYYRGMTINIVTIGALVIALGMLVDDAIVVMENIQRHNQAGGDRKDNAVKGASEVAMAVLSSTVTTIVVFIPVFYLESGELSLGMREFAGPVSVALMASLLVSLTVIPLGQSRIRPRAQHPLAHAMGRIATRIFPWMGRAATTIESRHPLNHLVAWYRATVGWVLDHKLPSIMFVSALVAATVLIPYPRVGIRQMPELDMREVQITVQFDRNMDRKAAADLFKTLAANVETLREKVGIKHVYVDYSTSGGVIRAYLYRLQDLAPGETFAYTTDEVRDIFSQVFPQKIPGATLSFGVAQGGISSARSATVTIRGDDASVVAEYANRFKMLAEQLPNVSEVRTDEETAQDELQLDIDESLAFQAGVNPLSVARTVDFALRGIQLPYIKKQGRELPVRAQFASEDRKTKESLDTLGLVGTGGKLVPLSNIAKMERASVPPALYRENGKSRALVTVSSTDADMASLMRNIDTLTERFELPRGYTIDHGQELSELERSMRNYRQALIMALALIYLVMAASFESIVLPFSVLTTVPMGFVGIFWTVYLTNTPMDTVSFIGAILMCGVIVKNGIVIVDHINQLRLQGMERRLAVVTAGVHRFRPVIMTALTTILGCLPLAIGTGEQNDALHGLGRSMVGGLAGGTFLTLLVVPLFYVLIDDFQAWVGHYLHGLGQLITHRPASETMSTGGK